ncbi:MAG: hypothetical protein J6B87_02630 [Clostridia bacterium]|nr:hypothetical protein [Clostridia bacterium]
MLKLSREPIKTGIRFVLRESWHDKLAQFSRFESLPYEYILIGSTKGINETYYIFQSEENVKGKKTRIAAQEFVVRYFLGQEVPDSNVGFYFKEYLPVENTQILVTSDRNPNEVIPAILKFEAGPIQIEDGSYIPILRLRLFYMNGISFADVKSYTEGVKKYTWKFLYHEDESYMNDYEKTFRDVVIHKEYVKKSAEKLIHYLTKEGATSHANLLRQRAQIHDDSKMSCIDEMHALSRIINDKTTLRDASAQLSPIKKDAIALHWKHNSHHPEHFDSVIDMTKIDIMEMCCDWHARSTQYKTDLLEFVKKQQEERFHFPDWMFAEIWHYCNVLTWDI